MRRRVVSVLVVLLLAGCTTIKRCAYEGFDRDEQQQPARVIETLARNDSAIGVAKGHIAELVVDIHTSTRYT